MSVESAILTSTELVLLCILGLSVLLNVAALVAVFKISHSALTKNAQVAEAAIVTRQAENAAEATDAMANLEYNRAALEEMRGAKEEKKKAVDKPADSVGVIRDQATGKTWDLIA